MVFIYNDLPRVKGSYCLIYQLHETISIQIGKLGRFEFNPGFYFYVGSAKGAGGLHARINRHLSVQQKKFWHIDYLKSYLTTVGYFYSKQLDNECLWSQCLKKCEEIQIPVSNFGASDCKNNCSAHLLMIPETELSDLKKIIFQFDCEYDQLVFL